MGQLLENHSCIDILVNNAGTILRAPAAEHGDKLWDKVIAVNLNAQFVLAREIGKGTIERGRGKIIFTVSLLSFQGGITVPGYAASNGAIEQLTMALSNEWAKSGVCVNAIAPATSKPTTRKPWEGSGSKPPNLGANPCEPMRRAQRFQRPYRLSRKRCFELCDWHDLNCRRWLDGKVA